MSPYDCMIVGHADLHIERHDISQDKSTASYNNMLDNDLLDLMRYKLGHIKAASVVALGFGKRIES